MLTRVRMVKAWPQETMVLIRWVWLRTFTGGCREILTIRWCLTTQQSGSISPQIYSHPAPGFPMCKIYEIIPLPGAAMDFLFACGISNPPERIEGTLDARSALRIIGEKEHVTTVHLVTCKV